MKCIDFDSQAAQKLTLLCLSAPHLILDVITDNTTSHARLLRAYLSAVSPFATALRQRSLQRLTVGFLCQIFAWSDSEQRALACPIILE